MKKFLTFAAGLLACASLTLTATPASARSDVSVGINIGVPGLYAEPVYIEPRPIYVEPRPVYVEPRVIYTQPRPLYIERSPGYYHRPQWEDRGHRGRRHWKEREHRRQWENERRDHGGDRHRRD